jgi:hypothetical protein
MTLSTARDAAKATLQLYGIDVTELQAETVARGVLLAMREPGAVALRAGRELLIEFDPVRDSAHQRAGRIWEAVLVAAINEGL